MAKTTTVIIKNIYPVIEASMNKNANSFKKCVERFFITRQSELYDTVPCSHILFGKKEYDDFWSSIKIEENQILGLMQNCFFMDISYNPPQLKEPFTVAMLLIIRYFFKKGRQKDAKISAIYLAFSGKFYASVHAQRYPTFVPNREIMEFVINYKLTDKFDIKKEGNVFGAIRKLCTTWLDTYKSIFISSSSDDDDFGTVTQQLRDREKIFHLNIAKFYFESYKNKDYLNYESDNLGEDKFRITENDSIKANKYTENTINSITSNDVNYKFCKMIANADNNIKTDELKSIIESIISNNDNLSDIRTAVNILITNFMTNNKGKDIPSIEFLNYSMAPKPNSKDKDIIELKSIINNWLSENSPGYNRRKSRLATANSYYKCTLFYFVLVINQTCR